MYWHGRRASDGADWEAFWCLFLVTVVAFGGVLADRLDLAFEARCPTFYEKHIRQQTHAIDVTSGIQVIERVEDEVEGLEPSDVKVRLANVCMMSFYRDAGVEALR